MDIRTRLIASSFTHPDDKTKIFDIDSFVKRTLLFQTYIIDSEGLEEIPNLLRVFGFDGLLELFDAKIFKLNCFYKMTGSLGPNLFINEPKIRKNRPLLNYSFAETSTGDFYYNVGIALKKVEAEINLSARQLIRLRRGIYSSFEKPNEDEGELSLKSTKNDLETNPTLLTTALVMAIKNQLGLELDYKSIDLKIQYDNNYDFNVSTNIQNLLPIDTITTHKIIEKACLAIAKRNDRIQKMKEYSALSGFNDNDIPLFTDKLEFLNSVVDANVDQNRFQRIIELNGLPQVKNDDGVRLSARDLIKIRESTEATEFRQWLSTTDNMSDSEIVKQTSSFSKVIGRILGGETGQNIRFLFTNGLGFIPPPLGTIISLPLSVLDHFVIDKFFPRSGVAAFIGDMYPSLFKD